MLVDMNIHRRVQLARAGTVVVNNYIGKPGELVVDTDRWELRLHDGAKKGGHRFLSSTALSTIFVSVESEAGKLNFSGGQFGIVTRVSDSTYKIRSLVAEDGITLENARGVDDNFTIGLPDRLKAISTNYAPSNEVADADLILDSGFYALNANAINVPDDILDIAASTLIVIRRSATEATQLITSVQNIGNSWIRAMISGAWQDWVVLKPAEGSDSLLEDGTDNVQRTWTAKQIAEFITDRLKDIGNEDGTGTVLTYGGSQKKFKDSWGGPSISDKTFGPFGTQANKDRWIIYLSTVPKVVRQGGSGGTDRLYGGGFTLELEMAGNWQVAMQVDPYTGLPGERNPPADNSVVRFQYDATGGSEKILVTNGDWVTTKTLTGIWSGRIKITTSTQTVSMSASGYKFKLKP